MRRPTPRATVTALAVTLAALPAGCSGVAAPAEPAPLVLTSPDLDADGTLPAWGAGRYSTVCRGENRSPALAWQGGPDDVVSWLLTLTDPAHPEYVHWVVTGIPGDVEGIDQAAEGDIDVGVVGASYRGDALYAGPCAPGNTYVYTLYALDADVTGDASTTLEDALALAEGHVLDSATLDAVPAES